MEREIAKIIAERASFSDLIKTLQNAEFGIKDWKERSIVNRNVSKGTIFNSAITTVINKNSLEIDSIKVNLIREFGEFFPDIENIIKECDLLKIRHEDPIEPDWFLITGEEPPIIRIR